MTNFIVIFACLILGLFAQKVRHFPHNTGGVLNAFIIYLSLPSLVLSQIPKLILTINQNNGWWIPVSMAWITFALSFVIVGGIGKKLNWSPAKTGALILTVGLGNTSFVGIPLLEALLGTKAVPIAILVDQPGSFLVLSTLGIIVAAIYSGSRVNSAFIMKRVFTFPPFLALLFSVGWAFLWGKEHPESLAGFTAPFEKVASTLVPLALFSVGYQLKLTYPILQKRWKPLLTGLMLKLFLFPLIFLFFYSQVLTTDTFTTKVIILESAMATMITSAIVATEFHLDSEIANLMVGVSIPISLISVPLWRIFLGF